MLGKLKEKFLKLKEKVNLKTLTIGVVGLLLIGGIAVGGYWYLNRESTNDSENKQTNEVDIVDKQPFSEWETYKNEDYGYLIKYPDQYLAYEINRFGSARPVPLIHSTDFYLKDAEFPLLEPQIRISVFSGVGKDNLEDWFQSDLGDNERWGPKWLFENINQKEDTLNGMSVMRYTSESDLGTGLDSGETYQTSVEGIAFIYKDNLVTIENYTWLEGQENGLKKTYEKIIESLELF